jgi:hypothetical protein
VTDAILRAVHDIGVDRVPLALAQQDVMGTREEARTSGLARVARRADLIAAFLARQRGVSIDDLTVLVAANALSGALSSAWAVWAGDGIDRRPLIEYVSDAIAMVSEGLTRSLDDEGGVVGR